MRTFQESLLPKHGRRGHGRAPWKNKIVQQHGQQVRTIYEEDFFLLARVPAGASHTLRWMRYGSGLGKKVNCFAWTRAFVTFSDL